MSRSLNKVQLIGNLGGDPEVRTTNNGSKVAQFNVATSRSWNSASGERQEKTEWHRCVVWNTKFSTLADTVERYLHKGDRVYVEGAVEYRQWQDKEGQTRYTTEINVRELIMLGGRGGSAGEGGEEGNYRARGSAPSRNPAASGTTSSKDDFEDFPGALDNEDDDLPF